MAWPDGITPPLPAPLDEEPPELRAAIVDELADHLTCALDRERRRTDDETAARRAVLDRFGDPDRVARRLWLDAMKDTIMNQRMALVTNAVLAVAVIAICILTYSALRQNARVTTALIERLEALPEGGADAGAMEWTNAVVRLADPAGNPIAGYDLTLTGRPFDGASEHVSRIDETTDAQGAARFGPIRPGPFSLLVRDDAQREHTQSLIFYPGRENVFDVEWPAFDGGTRGVAIDLDVPDDLADAVQYCRVVFVATPPADGAPDHSWKTPPLTVLVAPDGRVARLDGSAVEEYRDMPHQRRRARIDAAKLSFTDTLAVERDLIYELGEMHVYFDIGEGDPSVHYSYADRGRNRGGRGSYFAVQRPFAGAGAAPWTIPIPAETAQRLRSALDLPQRTANQ